MNRILKIATVMLIGVTSLVSLNFMGAQGTGE